MSGELPEAAEWILLEHGVEEDLDVVEQDQVVGMSQAVTARGLSKLDVAGSNPVGRSNEKGLRVTP